MDGACVTRWHREEVGAGSGGTTERCGLRGRGRRVILCRHVLEKSRPGANFPCGGARQVEQSIRPPCLPPSRALRGESEMGSHPRLANPPRRTSPPSPQIPVPSSLQLTRAPALSCSLVNLTTNAPVPSSLAGARPRCSRREQSGITPAPRHPSDLISPAAIIPTLFPRNAPSSLHRATPAPALSLSLTHPSSLPLPLAACVG